MHRSTTIIVAVNEGCLNLVSKKKSEIGIKKWSEKLGVAGCRLITYRFIAT